MAKESFVYSKLFGSSLSSIKRPDSNQSLVENTIKSHISLQELPRDAVNLTEGELFRYKKSSKELNIPRWCTLTAVSFQYYKSQISAICGEKALFCLPVLNIIAVKAFANKNEYFFEILTVEDNMSPYSTKFTMQSTDSAASERHLLNKPRHLETRIGKFTKPNVNTKIIPNSAKLIKKDGRVRDAKTSWTRRENNMYLTEERLIFVVSKKGDWEKWQKIFKSLEKVEVIREAYNKA